MEETIAYPKFKEIEKKYIKDLLRVCNGSASKAARVSGISRATMYRKIKDYKIR